MSHCERGDEYIVGQMAHTYRWEGGGAAVLGSIQPQPIEQASDGTIPIDKIAAAIKPLAPGLGTHFARTDCWRSENTWGGRVLPQHLTSLTPPRLRAARDSMFTSTAPARSTRPLPGLSVAELLAPFDSASFASRRGSVRRSVPCWSGDAAFYRACRALEENARRWHASVGLSGGRLHLRDGEQRRTSGGRSRQCSTARRRLGEVSDHRHCAGNQRGVPECP